MCHITYNFGLYFRLTVFHPTITIGEMLPTISMFAQTVFNFDELSTSIRMAFLSRSLKKSVECFSLA